MVSDSRRGRRQGVRPSPLADKFQIDEVQAFILLRSFLYNQGLPSTSNSDSMVAELVEAIGPFFSSEYLHTFRVLLPLFRAQRQY